MAKQVNNDNPSKKYYEYLSSKGVDVPPTYESFERTLQDDDSRKKYYEYLQTKDVDIAPTYESFSSTLVKKKVQAEPISEDFIPTSRTAATPLEKQSVNPFVKTVSKNPNVIDVVNPQTNSVDETMNYYESKELVNTQKLNNLTTYLKSPDLYDITRFNLDKEKTKEIKTKVLDNFDYLDTLPKEDAEKEIKKEVFNETQSKYLSDQAVQEFHTLKDYKTTLITESTQPDDEYAQVFGNITEYINKNTFGVDETDVDAVIERQNKKNKAYNDYANYLKETNKGLYEDYKKGILNKDNRKSMAFYEKALEHQGKLLNAKAAADLIDPETYNSEIKVLQQDFKEAITFFPDFHTEVIETIKRTEQNDEVYNELKRVLDDPNSSLLDKTIAKQGIVYYNVTVPVTTAIAKYGANVLSTIGRGAAIVEGLTKPEFISMEDGINELVDDFSNYFEVTGERLMPKQLQGALFEDGEFQSQKLIPKVSETMANMYTLIAGGGFVGKGLKEMAIGEKTASNTGLFVSSFMSTYNDYRTEALNEGNISEDKANIFAVTSATLNAGLEMISPQRYLTGAPRVVDIKKAVKEISKGTSIGKAIINNTSHTVKETRNELIQEGFQKGGDVGVKAVFNKVTGTEFDLEVSADEMKEIGVLTTIAAGKMSVIGYKGNNTLRLESFEYARQNQSKVNEEIKKDLYKEVLGEKEIEQVKKDIKEYSDIYDAMPDKYNEEQKSRLAYLELNNKRLKEKKQELEKLNPEISKEEVVEIDEVLNENNNEVKKVLNKGVFKVTEEGEEKSLTNEEITKLVEDEDFIKKVAEGEIDLKIQDNIELGTKVEEKVREYNAIKAIDETINDSETDINQNLETDETTETETTGTTTTEGVELDTKTKGEDTDEGKSNGQDSKSPKKQGAKEKYGVGKKGATGKVPLDKRAIKNPIIKRAVEIDIAPTKDNVLGVVKQYFAQGGFKILSQEISDMFNGSKEEVKKRRFSMIRTPEKGGVTIDELVHLIYESLEGKVDDYYIKNAIEEVINSNNTREVVSSEIIDSYSDTGSEIETIDGVTYKYGEEVTLTPMGYMTDEEIEIFKAGEELQERKGDLGDEYFDMIDYFNNLTDEEIEQIDQADESFVDSKLKEIDNQTKEQPKTKKQIAQEKLDKARQEFRKGGGLSTGGLQNLEQFVNLVSAYVELGIVSVQAIIADLKKNNQDVSEEDVTKAINILKAREDSLDVVKKGLDDVNTTTNQALEQGYESFIKETGEKLSKLKYKEWVAESITQKVEKAKIKRVKEEVETLFENEDRKKADQEQKTIKLAKIKNDVDVKKAQTILRDYAKKILPNTNFVKREMLGVMTAMKNIKTDRQAESVKKKIDAIADKAKMRSKVAQLSKYRRVGIKNLKTKLGTLYPQANTILRLKEVPEHLFEKYEEVVKMLGERAAVLSINTKLVHELAEDIQVHFAVNESLNNTKYKMTDEEKQNKAIQNQIKERLRISEEIEFYKKSAPAIKKLLESKEVDFNNKDIQNKAIQFASLPKDYLETLSSKELENINKELNNLGNNFKSNGVVENRVIDFFGYQNKNALYNNENIIDKADKKEWFESPKDKELRDAITDAKELEVANMKASEKARKAAERFNKKDQTKMRNHISELVKSIQNTAFYENTQSLFTKAYEASKLNTKKVESKFNALLEDAIKSSVGKINFRAGRTTDATFEISTKISYILRELEHQANKGNSTTPSLKDIFAKQKEDWNDLGLSENNFKIMQKAYENIIKYEKDGVIDLNTFIDKELSKEEQKLLDFMRDTYKEYSQKYVYVAHLQGKTPMLTNEYSHRTTKGFQKEMDSEQLWQNIASGSFSAGSTIERTTEVPLITPFALNDFISYVDEINTVYFMTPIVKEFNATVKKTKAEGNQTTQLIMSAMADNMKQNLIQTFKRNNVIEGNFRKGFKIIVRNVSIKMLIGGIRLFAETSNLITAAIRAPLMIRTRMQRKELNKDGFYGSLIEEYGSALGEVLVKGSKGKFSTDLKDASVSKVTRKGMKGTDISTGDALVEFLNNNMAKDFGEKTMNLYYNFVDIALSSTHKSVFLKSFEKITGQNFDVEKYKNDLGYKAKYDRDVRTAIAQADVETSDLYNTRSQMESKLQGKGDDPLMSMNLLSNFMQSFAYNERSVMMKSLRSAIGNGSMSKEDGAVKFVALTVRAIMYDTIMGYISNYIYGLYDDDEDEIEEALNGAVANTTALFVYGHLPAWSKILINTGVNQAFKIYKERVQKETYSPRKDDLLFGNKMERARDAYRLFGALGSVMITGLDAVNKTYDIAEKLANGEEVSTDDLIEMKVLSTYYDVVATTFGLPFLRDVKVLEKKLTKESSSSSHGKSYAFGVKKSKSNKQIFK